MKHHHEWTDPTPSPITLPSVSPTQVWGVAAVAAFIGIPLVSLGVLLVLLRWLF